MKHLQVLFFISLFSLTAANVMAGSEVGNGGDAVVCKEYTTLLDVHEAKQRGFILNLSGNTMTEKVEDLVNRFRTKDPYNGLKLKKYASDFLEDLENRSAFTQDNLVDISDSLELSIPQGCRIEQMVIRRKVSMPFESRHLINNTLWNQLSEDDQAMTVLHEAYYRLLIEYGAKDSRLVRYLNGLFASTHFDRVNLDSYTEILSSGLAYGIDMPVSFSFKKFPTLEDKIFILKRSKDSTFDKTLFQIDSDKMLTLGLCKSKKSKNLDCFILKDSALNNNLLILNIVLLSNKVSAVTMAPKFITPDMNFSNGTFSIPYNIAYYFYVDHEGYITSAESTFSTKWTKLVIDGVTHSSPEKFKVDRLGNISL